MRDLRKTYASVTQIGAGHRTMALILLSALLVAAVPAAVQDPAAGPEPTHNQDVQILTRGPVHEAFALPVVNDPKPGLTVAKQPPAPVEEAPPDQKPAGQNVQWISGYWSWDASRDDFLWVSGVWREPPPGRQWVPGYWNQVEGGYQWVAGAWVPVRQAASGTQTQAAAQNQSAYVPAPPSSLETGPNSPAPSADVFWSPGSWYWQDTRYVWRPASGRPFNRAGSGFLLTTSGRRGEPCSSKATGICRWPRAASSSPPCITRGRFIFNQPMSIPPQSPSPARD